MPTDDVLFLELLDLELKLLRNAPVPIVEDDEEVCVKMDIGVATFTPRENETEETLESHDGVPVEHSAPANIESLPSRLGKGVPWTNNDVPMPDGDKYVAMITPTKNETFNFAPAVTDPSVVTEFTLRKNANDSNGVSLEFTGITSGKNEYHDEFVTGITPPKHKYHDKFVTGITPKNEYTPQTYARGIPSAHGVCIPLKEPLSSRMEDTVPWTNNGVPMEDKDGLYHGISDKAKEYITNITPRKNDTKNEIINFAQAVTDFTGNTPKTDVTKYNPNNDPFTSTRLND